MIPPATGGGSSMALSETDGNWRHGWRHHWGKPAGRSQGSLVVYPSPTIARYSSRPQAVYPPARPVPFSARYLLRSHCQPVAAAAWLRFGSECAGDKTGRAREQTTQRQPQHHTTMKENQTTKSHFLHQMQHTELYLKRNTLKVPFTKM